MKKIIYKIIFKICIKIIWIFYTKPQLKKKADRELKENIDFINFKNS